MKKPPSLVDPVNIGNMIRTARATPSGCFVEVGVYKGGTAWHLDRLARRQNRALFLYDTFEGIPFQDVVDHHKVGDFGDTDYTTVAGLFPKATVVKGVFPASAVKMGPVAFVHLDCDQYHSIKNAVRYLLPWVVSGGVLWFDDSPVLVGARKAVHELFGNTVQEMNGKHFVQL